MIDPRPQGLYLSLLTVTHGAVGLVVRLLGRHTLPHVSAGPLGVHSSLWVPDGFESCRKDSE